MGRVQQRAGGGKVTTENLVAGNIKSGVTVTVKQGSKTVQSVTGKLLLKKITVYEFPAILRAELNVDIDMKAVLPDEYESLTRDNFAFSAMHVGAGGTGAFSTELAVNLTYDAGAGILHIGGRFDSWSAGGQATMHGSVICYYTASE